MRLEFGANRSIKQNNAMVNAKSCTPIAGRYLRQMSECGAGNECSDPYQIHATAMTNNEMGTHNTCIASSKPEAARESASEEVRNDWQKKPYRIRAAIPKKAERWQPPATGPSLESRQPAHGTSHERGANGLRTHIST